MSQQQLSAKDIRDIQNLNPGLVDLISDRVDPLQPGSIRMNQPEQFITVAARARGATPGLLSEIASNTGLFEGVVNTITDEDGVALGFMARPTGSDQMQTFDLNLRQVANTQDLVGGFNRGTLDAFQSLGVGGALGAAGIAASFLMPRSTSTIPNIERDEILDALERDRLKQTASGNFDRDVIKPVLDREILLKRFQRDVIDPAMRPPPDYFQNDPNPGQRVPVGVPLDNGEVAAAALAAAKFSDKKKLIDLLNDRGNVEEAQQSYDRTDNYLDRINSQRNAIYDQPLYDYSQVSGVRSGLLPGNRPAII